MDTASQLLSRELGKPAFDLIDPGGGSRCEMHMVAWSPGEPGLDHRGLVGGIVVHDDVDIESFGQSGIDLFEEVEKLGGPVALVAFADDEAGGDIEGGE